MFLRYALLFFRYQITHFRKVDNIFIIGVFERKKWHNMAFCLKLDGFNTKNEKSISANLRNFVKHRTMD